ncbi:S-layer homology domain-containing protein [Paenibacillus sp. UNCCL117]|uniref:S-layer homology domain-containing protein n=1 Tax=unclassified Paenibacillus TaxID=185978 RepID=UPI00088840A0|nr:MULTISPECIES: S-layer homology domain-containing protein [unclassified Paenibacillus]SDD78744.1 S-layer homology domain-containing protein [Paenibacillus sp. cl123]SFW53040.1 S-layer homology domain-containing protein [Paenibacillus sp. UNCCL117]
MSYKPIPWLAFLLLVFAALGWSSPAEAAAGSKDKDTVTVSAAAYGPKLAALYTSPELALGFNPDERNYSISVPYDVKQISLWARSEDSQASVTINGKLVGWNDNFTTSLEVGSNTITINVSLLGERGQYEIKINRQAGATDDSLGSLSASPGRMYPSFSPNTTEYTLYIDYPIEYAYVTAYVRNKDKATLQFNGQAFPDGSTVSNKKPLTTGETSLVITVVAQNGNSTAYTITIKRGGPTSHPMPSGSSGTFDVQPIAKTSTDRLTEPFGVKKVQLDIALAPYQSALAAANNEAVLVDGTASQLRPYMEVKLLSELWRAAAANNKTLLVHTNEVDISLKPLALPQSTADASVLLTVKPVDLTARKEWTSRPSSAGRTIGAFELGLESVGEDTARWARPMTTALKLDPLSITQASKLGAYRYDEPAHTWVFLGGELKKGNRFEFQTDTLGLIAVFEENRSYSDIQGHWAESYISIMTSKQIAGGVGEGKFAPDEQVTRAEFASMLSRTMNLQETASVPFPDVPADAWYRYDIAKAVSAGLIEGLDNGSFLPQATITREQMAAMMMRAYSLKTKIRQQDILLPPGSRFSDESDAADWALRSVRLADAVGLMNGAAGGAFHPKQTATRAEALVVLYRLMNKEIPRP